MGIEAAGASRAERVERVAGVRRKLAVDGPPWTRRDETGDFARVTLPERDCDLVRDLLVAERVERVVEIGLAYGSSALAVGEALVTVDAADPLHLVLDPFQESDYANVGWDLLRSAGLDGVARLVAERSQLVLPRLVADGFTADAAFVDGSHHFHHVFADLYFLREIVRPGGLVVLDDVAYPSVGTAAAYCERNLRWQPVAGAVAVDGAGAVEGAVEGGSAEPPRIRAYRLPDPAYEPGFKDFHPFG